MYSVAIQGLLLASVHPLVGHGWRLRYVEDVIRDAATFDREVVAVFDAQIFAP